MDYSALKMFMAVALEGGFSRASEKIFRTQPAISLAVRRLERELGQQLIHRGGRELRLTDSGEMVLQYAKRILNLEQEMKNSLSDLQQLAMGRLTIGANESSSLYLLQHVLRFRKSYPRITVRIRRCRSSEIPDQLLSGDLELAVISYEPLQPGLESEVIYTDHLAFILSPKHRLAGRKSVSIRELGMETFIAHNVVSPYRQLVVRKFHEHGVPLNMDVEMPTIETIRKVVQMNEGVAFLPRMCVDHEIRQGVVKEVSVKELKLERKIRLVYRKQRNLSRASQAFLDLLRQSRPLRTPKK